MNVYIPSDRFCLYTPQCSICLVLIENVPQLMLQYWFMFEMNLGGNIVVISFISSIFNILRALTSAAIFWILHRNQTEVPFTINLSWKKKGSSSHTAVLEAASVTKGDLDPFTQCGRREALAIALGEINVIDGKSMKFEILSSQKQQSSCTLCGVFLSEHTVKARARAQTEGDVFSNFMDREREIEEAVISAFDLDPVYCSKFIFTVKMTRSTATSPAERAKLALDILREFKVSAEAISTVESQIKRAIDNETAIGRTTNAVEEGKNIGITVT